MIVDNFIAGHHYTPPLGERGAGPNPLDWIVFNFRVSCFLVRMSVSTPPEFGPNGAVLNSDTMTDGLRDEYEGRVSSRSLIGPKQWGWRLVIALMPLLIVWQRRPYDPIPVWLAAMVSVVIVAGFIRDFWPVGRVERIVWTIAYAATLLPALMFAMGWIGTA